MPGSTGRFVWYELMTTDAESAAAFYRAVVGWRAEDSGMPDRSYTILSAGETPVGGLLDLTEAARAAGAHPGWIGYIGVPDTDAVAARAAAADGRIHRAPDDIPGVGRFAVVADPQGAAFVLFTPLDQRPAPPPAGATPGHVGWHELHATDREAAFAFYADLFGWTKADAIDMGPMGIYQLFASGGPAVGGPAVGGMMTRTEAVPSPFWLYYINVDDTEAAVIRVRDAGGRVTNGPHQVPGGSWIAHCIDPQGVLFAIVGPDR